MPERTTSREAVTLTATECAVLGLLTRGEMSGYDLQKAAERSVGYFWTPAKSQIYAVLPRLVAAGLVKRRDVAQRGRPDKQLYRITKRGRGALTSWLEAGPAPPEPSRNPLLLKVFFGDLMSREALVEQIRVHRRNAEELKEQLEEIEARTPAGSGDLYPALTRKYGLRYARAVIRWAREAERELEQQ